jgi:hypothetical protein
MATVSKVRRAAEERNACRPVVAIVGQPIAPGSLIPNHREMELRLRRTPAATLLPITGDWRPAIGDAVPAHHEAWQAIVDSADQPAAVARHLSVLTASDQCRSLLDDLLQRLRRVEVVRDRLHLVFEYTEYPGEECEVRCRAPYEGPDGEVPASMLAVARVHNGIGWEYGGGGGIGFNGVSQGGVLGGGLEWEALTEAEQENAEFLARVHTAGLTPEEVESPGDYGQNWLIWDPAERNALDEPVLYFVSHGDCVAVPVDEARDLAYGPQLLRLMVQDIRGRPMFAAVYS